MNEHTQWTWKELIQNLRKFSERIKRGKSQREYDPLFFLFYLSIYISFQSTHMYFLRWWGETDKERGERRETGMSYVSSCLSSCRFLVLSDNYFTKGTSSFVVPLSVMLCDRCEGVRKCNHSQGGYLWQSHPAKNRNLSRLKANLSRLIRKSAGDRPDNRSMITTLRFTLPFQRRCRLQTKKKIE